MFRAFLIAIGISMCIVGGECLIVDQAVVAYPKKSKKGDAKANRSAQDPFSQQTNYAPTSDESGLARREIRPPEWAPWSLLSGGVVVSLYALTVQRD